jgi:lysophospholipase L1-like esterase
MVNRLTKIAVNLLLVLSSSCLVLGIAEIILRLEGSYTYTQTHFFTRYHPVLGWEKIPGKEGKFKSPEYTTFEKVNSKGLRGKEYSYEKPKGIYRILFLGDSFTEGYSVNEEMLFTNVLQRKLEEEFHTNMFQIINGGTTGYSTDQEYLFFKHEGGKYSPDLVIIMMYYNDIYYNIKPYYLEFPKPLLDFSNGGIAPVNTPLPQKKDWLGGRQTEGIGRYLIGIKSWVRRLSLYEFLRYRIRQIPALSHFLQRVGIMTEERLCPGELPHEFGVFFKEPLPEIDKAWDATQIILRNLKRRCKDQQIQLAVFMIPDRFQIGNHFFNLLRKRYPSIHEESWDNHLPNRKMESICRQLGIDFIDPLETFVSSGKSQSLYYPNDGHFTPDGNRLVADILFSYITRYTPFVNLRSGNG